MNTHLVATRLHSSPRRDVCVRQLTYSHSVSGRAPDQL